MKKGESKYNILTEEDYHTVRNLKDKAIRSQWYEGAAHLRDFERMIMKHLEEVLTEQALDRLNSIDGETKEE